MQEEVPASLCNDHNVTHFFSFNYPEVVPLSPDFVCLEVTSGDTIYSSPLRSLPYGIRKASGFFIVFLSHLRCPELVVTTCWLAVSSKNQPEGDHNSAVGVEAMHYLWGLRRLVMCCRLRGALVHAATYQQQILLLVHCF